jgi:hypothetical protein
LNIILAVSFGWFEAAERKGAHMPWDVSFANVSYATYREILSYETSRRSGIRNTEITNVRIEHALLLVNCANECVPAVTSTG